MSYGWFDSQRNHKFLLVPTVWHPVWVAKNHAVNVLIVGQEKGLNYYYFFMGNSDISGEPGAKVVAPNY